MACYNAVGKLLYQRRDTAAPFCKGGDYFFFFFFFDELTIEKRLEQMRRELAEVEQTLTPNRKALIAEAIDKAVS